MARTNKLSKIFVILLFVVVAATLTFAFVNVPIGTANADEPLVLEGQTADYIVTADENLQKNYDVTTNTYTAPKGMDSVIVLKVLAPTSLGILKFKFVHGSLASGYGLDVYFSHNGDDSFEINDGDEYLPHIAEIHAPGYELVEPEPMDNLTYENDIITINQLYPGDVIKIKFHNAKKGSPTISGLKMNEQEYSVTAKIEGEAHGTVSIGDDVTSADKDSVSANIKEGHTATFTVKPDDDYYAFWQDSTGKVVGCENSFTTDMIFAETNYIVRFEKYVSAGSDGQAKITYDSTLDETADFGWKKSDTEGRYELTDIKHFATGNNVHASAPGILTLTLTFDGEKVVSFDYLLERAMQQTSGEIIEYPVQLLRLYFIVDGEGVTTDSLKAEPTGEEEFWSEPYNYKFEKGSTGLKETAAVTDEQAGTGATTSIEAMIKGEGHHKVEFVIVSMLTTGIPFYKDVTKCYVENIQVKDPTPHTFTLDYDDNLGNIIVTGAKKGEGNSWTGYDGFPITFEASTTEVESSLDKKTQVPTHFINWTVGDSQPTDTTLNLMFKDGKLTYGDKELTANEVKALFQEETIKPTAFRQISKETSDTQQITDGDEVKLNINEAAETQLRLITAGYGKENEEIVFKVNGANTSLQTVKRNDSLGELGDLMTEEILSEFNDEVQDLKWWVQPNLGKQLVLEVAYTCDGYFGESVLTMYLTYTADAKDLGLSNNSLNNVFTSDSEDGAYITTSNPKGEGDELWSATSEWEGDNGSIVFENNLHNINNLEQYSPGITSGQDRDKFWYYSYVRIGISQNGGAKRKGVLMFDIRLDITGGNGDRKGAVVVERRDHTATNGPERFEGTDVDYTPTTGLSYKDGTFNRSCITSVLEYTNKTQIWGMNNPYVTDLGDGWYRCAFPTVRECDYLSEDDSYTHDTLQYFISFGFSGDVSARYAIRNMTFRNGTDAEFKFNANDPQNNGNVTAKVGDSSITSGQTVAFGSRVELTATETDGQKFYGWEIIDKDNNSTFYASTSVSGSEYKLSYTVLDPVTVVAWFGNGEAYEARVGGHFYATLDEAVKAAKELGTADIVIVKDKIHLASDLEISAGISLILPFSDEGLYFGSAASNKYKTENRIAWADGDENANKYLTFFIDNTATLTVKGNFFVGGVVNHVGQGYQGHTSGAYAEVINNGHIVIQDKGVMDVYGRVRGTGDIDVQSGDLKQPFLILDFMGGTETLGLFMDGVTPFKRYAMINIECDFTIHYGARLVGHATLYALQEFISLDQAFIGMSDDYGRDTMIMLKDGAYVTATYDPNKVVGGATSTNCTEKIGETTLHFYGGAWFSYMQFTAMGITVPTSGVFFSIPYNYNLQLDVNGKEEGTYETKTDFMIMPGAVVHVCEKAKLILHSNAWIYDGFEQATVANKTYPTASDLENGNYSKSGNLIVDGTLEIQKKFGLNNSTALPDQSNLQPAIFVGLVQTTSNTGKIVIDSQAILTFRPFDGTEGPSGGNYFAYNSTARVWDAAHGCFADLKAGKTYTAVKGKEGNDVTFTLDSIKYTNTKQSETDELTLTLDQEMHGSWMEDHKGHQLDWTPTAEELGSLTRANFCELTRKCSVMGCDHSTSMYLLKDLNVLTAQTFKGEAYTDEQLKEIFLKMIFGEQANTAKGKITIVIGQHDELKNVPVSPYQIEITLTGAGWWLAGSSKYEYARTFTFNIQKYDISEKTGLTVTDIGAKTYTGQQITVSDVDIQFANQKLAKGTDYTLGFGNNVNVKDGGTVTVTGAGNFTGSFELKFKIDPADISGGTLTVQDPNFVYNGQAQTPTRDHLIILNVAGFDNSVITVDIQATDNTNAGTAHVTVEGTGNFTGELSETFDIKKATATVTLTSAAGTYGDTPENIAFEVTDYKVDADKAIIEEAVQITHTATSNSGVGNYAVNVKVGELQNYEVNVKNGNRSQDGWTVQKVYTVNAKSIDGATVSIKEGKTYTYNGQEITPAVGEIEVTLEGWDKPITFTVKATSNKDAGQAHFTVTGTENYTGTSKQGDFTIEPAKVDIQVNSLSSAQGDELSTDYGYTFLNSTKFFGNDNATFDQKIAGKYSTNAKKDQISDQYKITLDIKDAQAALTNYTITVKEGVYTVTDSIFAGVTFAAGTVTYDGSKHTLTAQGTEKIKGTPKIEYKYQKGDSTVDNAWQDIPDGGFTDAGKYSIRVTITVDDHESKYQETRLLTIEPKNIEGATVTVGGEYTYTGKAITVDKANITVKLDAWSLPIDFDIDAEGYADNINATTDKQATVTITGKGNYTGTATGNFDIARKNISGGTLTVTGTYTYNGNAQTPQGDELSVTLQGFDNVSFKVKEEGGYENNTNATTSASKAKVTVEGTGNFVGELSAQFDIQQAKIDSVEVQNPETYIYNKTPIEPTLVVKSGTLTLDKDDYDIEYTTAEKEHTNAGTVTFTVKAKANSNFTGEVTGKSFVINKKQITVKLLKQTSVYTGVAPTVSSEQGIGWEVDGDAICEGDDLNIELRAEGLTAAAKTYVIDPKYSNPNYEVKWAPETAELEITPATITVTVKPASSTYGDAAAKLEIEVQGICSSDSTLNINDYVTLSCEVNEKTGYGTYDITCTKKSDPENYTINIVNNAKYTVNKKDVTVTINDQNATYNFEGKYDLDQTKWELADGQSLANGETKNALKVKLARVAITSAGEYAITGASDNPNYNVTFEGAWAQEDGNKGKAGVYTVAKKTLVHDGEYVIFMLAIGDDVDVEEKRSVKFVGEDIELSARIYVMEGSELSEITGYELSESTLTASGTYTIVVTINDVNYEGSRTFTVEVLTEEGYSQALSDALKELEEKVGDLTADALTSSEEHFEIIKQVKAILNALSEEDKQAGAEQLAKYEELVETWDAAADISDDVIETAKNIADMPIKWLFAMAEMSVLLAALYVVGKGGLM